MLDPEPVTEGVPVLVLEGVCVAVCVTVPDVDGVAPCDREAVDVDAAELEAVMEAVEVLVVEAVCDGDTEDVLEGV